MKKRVGAFTIVELLIVIVVIAILASISVVAYNGIQERARDAQRGQDIATIAKALEIYYAKYGRFPVSSGSGTVNGSWSTSNDTSWDNLASALVPEVISSLPKDPVNSPNGFTNGKSYSYSYYGGNSPNYCGHSSPGQMYIIVYALESGEIKNTSQGDCSVNVLGPYGGYSNYRVSKK